MTTPARPSEDALAIAAVQARVFERGLGMHLRPRVGATRDGLVFVALTRDEEGRHTGATLADACRAWLVAHPAEEGC